MFSIFRGTFETSATFLIFREIRKKEEPGQSSQLLENRPDSFRSKLDADDRRDRTPVGITEHAQEGCKLVEFAVNIAYDVKTHLSAPMNQAVRRNSVLEPRDSRTDSAYPAPRTR